MSSEEHLTGSVGGFGGMMRQIGCEEVRSANVVNQVLKIFNLTCVFICPALRATTEHALLEICNFSTLV